MQNQYGFALTRSCQTFTETTFEQVDEYYSGSVWIQFSGIRGSLSHVDGPVFNATLQGIFFFGAGWQDSSADDFAEYSQYVWSPASLTARVSLSVASDVLSYARDLDGDTTVNGAKDFAGTLGTQATTALTGSGKYPYFNYVGFSFHRNTARAHSYLQTMSLVGDRVDTAAFSSVTMKVRDGNNTLSGDILLSWFPSRGEWGISPYDFADPPGGGLWYVAEVEFTGNSGYGSAIYFRSDPYHPWNVEYSTETGFASTTTAEVMPGQCYMPADSAAADETMYFIETVPNGSSEAYESDTELFLFEDGDTEHWIALNNDATSDSFSDMQIALKKGATYYLKVVDLDGTPGTYSLHINTTGFLDDEPSATIAMGEDAYEDDDTSAGAKEIAVGVTQTRTLTASDADWVKIVVP